MQKHIVLLCLFLSVKVIAQVQPLPSLPLSTQVESLDSGHDSGEGRNGPDLHGSANPPGHDKLLNRKKVWDNICQCTLSLTENLYRRINPTEKNSKHSGTCSVEEKIFSINQPLEDGLDEERQVEVFAKMRLESGVKIDLKIVAADTLSRANIIFVKPNNQNSEKLQFYLPSLRYTTNIENTVLDQRGSFSNFDYSIVDLSFPHEGKLQNELLDGAVYQYNSGMDEMASKMTRKEKVNIEEYKSCLLNL